MYHHYGGRFYREKYQEHFVSQLCCRVQFIKRPYWVLKHRERQVLFCVLISRCACMDLPFSVSGSTLGHQLSFCFTQRPVSLHWTVKCSNLWWFIDGLWIGVKIASGLWYMGFPVLTLGSPFLLHIITRASTLSQQKWEMLCHNVAEQNADYFSYFPATKMKSIQCAH